jgi:hypothetical protein
MLLAMMAKNSNLMDRLFYQPTGQKVISAIFGLAIAFMFQRACKDQKCIVIQAPPTEELEEIHRNNNECYRYKQRFVECGASP